ncbi:hypothetical protein LCGC14_2215870 [marine sediment metagenome]|uniref:Uncharacterized protein n=1 Tax=marine sediment metagenome TaxID=412755 RepID=A0A0F9DCD9_9ZZZZ
MSEGAVLVLLAWVGYLLRRVWRLKDELEFERQWLNVYKERYEELAARD